MNEHSMNRKVNASEYGICFWSMATFKAFLKQEKIRSLKLLSLFQKNKKIFLKLVEKGMERGPWQENVIYGGGEKSPPLIYCIRFEGTKVVFLL